MKKKSKNMLIEAATEEAIKKFLHSSSVIKSTTTRVTQHCLLTSWRILLNCTSCFLKHTTSWSMEFLSDLSTTRSSEDELSNWDWRLSCWRALRCSLSDVFDGVLRLCMLSNDLGLSEPLWLNGEMLLFCKRRFSKRVALAGSCDLRDKKSFG